MPWQESFHLFVPVKSFAAALKVPRTRIAREEKPLRPIPRVGPANPRQRWRLLESTFRRASI
jgi:hypothetical protein